MIGEWIQKLLWQVISFKFLSFWVSIVLLVLSWVSLGHLYEASTHTAERLYKQGFITKEGATQIITHSQTVLYDQALSHLLLFFAAIFASVFAVKGMSYYTDSVTTKAVINKMPEQTSPDDLKKYLPTSGK